MLVIVLSRSIHILKIVWPQVSTISEVHCIAHETGDVNGVLEETT